MKLNRCFKIDPMAAEQLIAKPHPPINFTSEDERSAFADQIYKDSFKLFKRLIEAGFVGSQTGLNDEGVDFYMNSDVGSFRMLSLIVKNKCMLNLKLLPMLMDFLDEIGGIYSLNISCDIDDDTELFLIFVTSAEAVAAFETPKMAKMLGFDHRSPLIGPII